MGNINELLPQDSPIVQAIYAHYKRTGDAEPKRGYLGASIIGHPCERYLWYTFRQSTKPDIDGRAYRLFRTGDLEEARLVDDLRAIGCEVHEVDPATGQQFEVTDFGGHFSGHMDGCALGIPGAEKAWHVLEFKTHNAKSFAKLKKEGVRASKPMHFAQMQAYMHKTGMTRALYLAKNKDTDELYAERVRHDKAFAEGLMARAERIITSTTPPERIASRPDWYECSWCDAKEVCWGGDMALPILSISCRQCCFATPRMDGKARWICEKHGRALSESDQDRACDDHLCLPGMISFADPTGSGIENGRDFIEFTCDGSEGVGFATWRHGAGGFSTKELLSVSKSTIVNPVVERAKGLFDAEAGRERTGGVLARYTEDASFVVWYGHARDLQSEWTKLYGTVLSDLTPIAEDENLDVIAIEYPCPAGQAAVILDPQTKMTWILQGKA